jgi:hypothetical protein
MKPTILCMTIAVAIILLGASDSMKAQEKSVSEQDKRIEALERSIKELSEQLRALKLEREGEKAAQAAKEEAKAQATAQVGKESGSKLLDSISWLSKFTLGGYGEMHANFGGRGVPDQFDIHRLVLYLGYDFNDWIKFHSETEIEHAFVSPESDGELSVEQVYVDFLLSDYLNVRAGRILTPLGILNKKHEPAELCHKG